LSFGGLSLVVDAIDEVAGQFPAGGMIGLDLGPVGGDVP
jgi:hypothetical protein